MRSFKNVLKPRSIQAATRCVTNFLAIFCLISVLSLYLSNSSNLRANFVAQLSLDNTAPLAVQSTVCGQGLNVTRILIVLRIHPSYSDARIFIRQKIRRSPGCRMKAIFVYGTFTGSSAEKWRNIISHEAAIHKDIVQFRSIKDYQLQNEQKVMESTKSWLTSDLCAVYQHVTFGTFKLYHGQ
jgi:hypothetical protein